MQLTVEQVAAIKEGETVRVTSEEVGADCVVLRADLYDRVKNLIGLVGEMDPREAYSRVLRAWDEEGCPEDAELYRP